MKPLQTALRLALLYGLLFASCFAVINLPGVLIPIRYQLAPPHIRASSGSTAPTAEFRIVIPKIGVDAPVVLSGSRHWDAMHADLERGVVHYAQTALPGEGGNIALTGHSSNYIWAPGHYNYVFTLLDRLEPGDEVDVYYRSRIYRYRMAGKRVVETRQAEVLDPTPTETLTLITCWPRYTDWKRLVVTAVPLP